MKKVELLAPAGNLAKAKIALLYGADAVYVGGQIFSLRARASNFTILDIKELCVFAKGMGKKVYVTMNIIPHNEDFINIENYLYQLEAAGVNAIIVSSIAIIKLARTITPRLECHLSTQMSVANAKALSFYQKLHITRAVLAREVTLDEMQIICQNTPIELEVFIHGGMCSSYSGRCLLSNYFTQRDANRGGCAHSCRWNYRLFKAQKQLYKNHFFNMGSKDLMTLNYIDEILKLNITSLKIEGRMKSSYYLATVIKCYRKAIDLYYQQGYLSEQNKALLISEIKKAENRQNGIGFYAGIPNASGQLYGVRDEKPTKEYVGYVLDYNELTKIALIEQRNYFEVGDKLEIFGPNLDNTELIINQIIDGETSEQLTVARHPLQKLLIEVPFKVSKHDMIRKKI